jgi:hypothetical protein
MKMGMSVPAMNIVNDIMHFSSYFNNILSLHKPYLNKNIFNYWISLKEDSSVVLYAIGDNKYSIYDGEYNILPHGVYINDSSNYYGNDDMIIMDVDQFKRILLKNGFHFYFKFIEYCIYDYGLYLSEFDSDQTESLKHEVYGIL